MKKLIGIVGAVIASLLGLVVLFVVVVVVLLSTGALNGMIEDTLAAQIERPVQLEGAPSLGLEDGALTLRLGPVAVANAPWAAEQHPHLARIERLEAKLRLQPLLRGRIELPEVTVDHPQLHLARSEDGEVNWPEGEDEGPVQIPRIENLVIRNAEVTYADAAAGIDAEMALDQATARLGGDGDLALQASGRLQDAPLELRATGGSLEDVLNERELSEWTTIEATLGGSRISAQATSFADLEELDAKVEIDAEQALTEILAGMGIGTADLPPFKATATIEPGPEGSRVVADLTMAGASAHIDGSVDDPAAPEQGFSADLRVEGSRPADLLALAGVEIPGELPAFELRAQLAGGDGAVRLEPFEARLGDNTVSGQAVARYGEAIEAFEAQFALDAPEVGPILTELDVPYADQVPSAELEGEITHDGKATALSLHGSVGGDTLDLQAGYDGPLTAFENPRVDVHLEGSALGALPAQLDLATRPIESYRIEAKIEERAQGPSPVNFDATIEDTHVQFEGSLDELRTFKGIDGRFRAQGPNPAAVLELFKLPSISLPPYDMAGQVTWRGDELNVTGLEGTVGDSDISGDAGVALAADPPAITAELHSDLLDADDLLPPIGAPPATGPGETASPAQEQRAEQHAEDERLLPAKEIDPDLWRNLDLDVDFNADRIESEFLPIDRISIHVVSKSGWLTVDPLVTGLADGTIVGFVSMDATREPVAGEFDIRLEALQLQDMLAKLGIGGEGFGKIDGRIRLQARGTSARALLGSADGQAVVTMDGGAIDALIIEAIGLDIAESVMVLFDSMGQTEEDKTPIRCAIVNLQFEQGVATASPILIDTVDSKIIVDGQVNLRDETLDIFIESQPKDPSPLSANQPIHVDGPLLSPSVNPAPGRTESEGLGWLLAIAGALPFFDIGAAEDSPCGSLIAEAKDAAAAPPN